MRIVKFILKIITPFLVYTVPLVTLAQPDGPPSAEKRFMFGFNAGNGYPLADYGSASTSLWTMSKYTGKDTNRMAGYAKQGFHYDLYAAYRIIPHLSIMLYLSGDKDEVDINTLDEQYAAYFPPGSVSVFTANEFYVVQYLAGPLVNYPVSNYCSLEFKALAGYTTVYNPGMTFYNTPDTLIYTYSTGSGFGYCVGGGIKYNVETDGYLGVGFHLDVSYSGAFINYPNYTITHYSTTGTQTYSIYNVPKTMTVGLIQVSIGISLEL